MFVKYLRVFFLALVLASFAAPVLVLAEESAVSNPAAPVVTAAAVPTTSAVPVVPSSKIDTGDTAWVLTSTALVMLMTLPGLALFYGGLVRKKNVLSVLMQCGIMLCVVSLQWVLFGYSLAFGPAKGFWGGLQWIGLNGVGLTPYPDYSPTIPHQLFMIFQAMFAVITPALIIGAFAERMKFSAFLLFSILIDKIDPLLGGAAVGALGLKGGDEELGDFG